MPSDFDIFGRSSDFDNFGGDFSSFGVSDTEAGGGIISRIVRETARDFYGAGRVVAAGALSPFSAMGLGVPITIDDLTRRDVQGALMTAALGVGGVAAHAARGLPAIGRLAAGGFAGRAAATASAEAVAGAAFGLVRPLDEDEDRMRAVLGDAAFAGAFGAGASFAKSAAKATLGGYIARLKDQTSRAHLAMSAKAVEQETLAREVVGIRLANPDTRNSVGIRRNPDGRVVLTRYDEAGKRSTTDRFSSFNAALSTALKSGYNSELGPFRKRLLSSADFLDQATLDLVAEGGDEGVEILKGIRLSEYTAVREAGRAAQDADQHIASLVAEAVTEQVDELGAVKLSKSTREMIENQIALKGRDFARMSDAEILREGILHGLVNVDNIAQGVQTREWLRELFINDSLPNSITVRTAHNVDLFLGRMMLPTRVAKLHPEVEPLVRLADQASQVKEAGEEAFAEWLFQLRGRVSPEAAKRGRDIIDATSDIDDVVEAAAAARQSAAQTGDAGVVDFVEAVTGKLGEYLGRLQAAGRLEAGRSGYFPIFNANNWKLDIDGKFAGFYRTEAEALAAAAERGGQSFVTPTSFVATPRTANSGEFAAAPLKSSPFLKERKLGLHDFSKDPFEALEIYGANMERTLAFNDFERAADQILPTIPAAKPSLQRWSQQYVDDMMGRPRAEENAFQAIVNHLGINAGPRALKRYTAAIRKVVALSRLGGPWSAIINTTQIAINTFPKLGAKYTARGFEVLDPRKTRSIISTLEKNGFNAGVYVPFDQEGRLMEHMNIGGALKQKKYGQAMSRMWMYFFNGSERMNRLVTAWGATQRELANGKDLPAAVAAAKGVVELTQFNYRQSNIPEILRSPVGSVIGQFKSYFINEIDFISSLSKAEAIRFASAVGALGGVSALFNIPGVDLMNHASGWFMDSKLEEKAQIGASDSVWKRATVFGLPGIVNVDLSDYIGAGSFADLTRSIAGPAASDLSALGTFLKESVADISASGSVTHETRNNFLQQIAPSAIRRAMRGYQIAESGEVRNPYSAKLLYKPERRLREAWQTAFGAPSVRIAQERAADAITTRVRDRYVRARAGYAKEAALSLLRGDRAEARRVMDEAAASGFPLDERTLRTYMRNLSQPADKRREKRSPRAVRAELAELYDLTGATSLEQAGLGG